MMKPNAKIKLFLMLIAFLASFSLKNYSEMVDTVYGHGDEKHDEEDEAKISPLGSLTGGPSGGAMKIYIVEDEDEKKTEEIISEGEENTSDEEKKKAKEIYEEAFRFFEARKKLDETLSVHREQRDRETGLKKYKFIIDEQPTLIEKMKGFSEPYHYLPENIKKSLSDDIAKLEEEGSEERFNIVKKMDSQIAELQKKINESVTPASACPHESAKAEDEKVVADGEAKKEEREMKRIRRTLYGRVWSDFSQFLGDYDLDDPSSYEEVKEEMDDVIKEEVSDFLDKEFSELDVGALLKLDFRETKIPHELKSLDRVIRELKKKGRRLNRKPVDSSDAQAEKERELKSLAIQLYAAKRMKSRIESQVGKRFRAVRDGLIAAQTQSDEIKAQEERMVAMAKMFEGSDPMTKMLLLEMFGDPLAGGAPTAAPQGFSLDFGSSPGGGLRVGLGAQGAQSGFAFDFSQQPKDPFSGLFPGSNYGGSNPYGGFNPAFDPRRFGGSYWGN